MPLPPKKKKPAVGIELLLDEEGAEPMGDEAEDEDAIDLAEDDFAEDDEMSGMEDMADEMGGEMEDEAATPSVDPEHAALAEKLGFTDPEQQQALVDLIQLVLDGGSAPPAGKESGALPPLPESVY